MPQKRDTGNAPGRHPDLRAQRFDHDLPVCGPPEYEREQAVALTGKTDVTVISLTLEVPQDLVLLEYEKKVSDNLGPVRHPF